MNRAQPFLSSVELEPIAQSIGDHKTRTGDILSQISSAEIVLESELENRKRTKSQLAHLRSHLESFYTEIQPSLPSDSWEDNEEQILTFQSCLPDIENRIYELESMPITEETEKEILELKTQFQTLLAMLMVSFFR